MAAVGNLRGTGDTGGSSRTGRDLDPVRQSFGPALARGEPLLAPGHHAYPLIVLNSLMESRGFNPFTSTHLHFHPEALVQGVIPCLTAVGRAVAT
jgi:hypothetical protein